jgi:Ca-activated chloride channel family protein
VTALYELVPAGSRARSDENPFIANQREEPPKKSAQADFCMRVRLRYQRPGGSPSRLLETDVANQVDRAPEAATSLALAVAEFGLILRESPYRGEADWRSIERLAEAATESAEQDDFLKLVRKARRLSRN